METQQTNPAVVEIQNTIIELEKMIELYKQFDPEKAVQQLNQDQIVQIAKEFYKEAIENRRVNCLARYLAAEMSSYFLRADDNQAETDKTDLLNGLSYRIWNDYDINSSLVSRISDRWLQSNTLVDRVADRVLERVVEMLSESSFTLSKINKVRN